MKAAHKIGGAALIYGFPRRPGQEVIGPAAFSASPRTSAALELIRVLRFNLYLGEHGDVTARGDGRRHHSQDK